MPTKKTPSPAADPAPQSANAEYISALLKIAKDFTGNLEQIALFSIAELAELEKRVTELENVVAELTADMFQESLVPQEYDMNEGLLINVTQTAKLLGLSRPTVYRLIENGTLPAKKLTTGSGLPRTMVLAEDLKAFLADLPSAEGQPAS